MVSDVVDAVARAIFAADLEAVERPGYQPVWDELDPGDWGSREDYRRMAQAAIDALGLTEETATIPVVIGRVEHTEPCELPDHMIGGEEMHTCGFQRGHFEFHASARLVSPWVRKDSTDG